MSYYLIATRSDAIYVSTVPVGPNGVQKQVVIGAVPGVSVLAGAGRCGEGTGRLRSNADGSLQFKAPGSSTWGQACGPPVDGYYVLEDGEDPNQYVQVVVDRSFIAGAAEAELAIRDFFNGPVAHDNVTGAEAAAGSVESWDVWLTSASGLKIYNLKCWLDPDASGTAFLEISDDGVTWVKPDSEGHADVLNWPLVDGEAGFQMYLRRTIPPVTPADADVLNALHFAWDGY